MNNNIEIVEGSKLDIDLHSKINIVLDILNILTKEQLEEMENENN